MFEHGGGRMRDSDFFGRMFSLPHFQFISINISTILTLQLKTYVFIRRLVSWLSFGTYISWVELSVNKQIRLNCVLSLHLDLQYTVSFRKKTCEMKRPDEKNNNQNMILFTPEKTVNNKKASRDVPGTVRLKLRTISPPCLRVRCTSAGEILHLSLNYLYNGAITIDL